MSFEQLVLDASVGLGMGAIIAVASYLAGNEAWNNRKFAYSVIIGVFTAFAVIEALGTGITEANFISVLLSIAGVSFFTNKGIKMANRVRGIADEEEDYE